MTRAAVLFFVVFFMVGRVFIGPRLNVPSVEGCFESAAHIFVGYSLCLIVRDKANRWYVAALLLMASLWELGWFLVQKYL